VLSVRLPKKSITHHRISIMAEVRVINSVEGESLEDALERRRRKPVSAMNIDECEKKTFIVRLEKLTALLRWTRVIKTRALKPSP
jgi:hypothetical protein